MTNLVSEMRKYLNIVNDAMDEPIHKITIKYVPHPLPNPKEQMPTESHKSGDVFADGKYIGEVYFDKVHMINDGSFIYELNFCHRDAANDTPNFLRDVSYTFDGNPTENEIRKGIEVLSNDLAQRYTTKYKKQFTPEVIKNV